MKCFLKLGRKVIFKALTVTMLLGAFMVFMGGWAWAEEKSVTEKILDILLQSRQISQEQYDTLLKQADAEKLAAAQAIAEAQKAEAAQKAEEEKKAAAARLAGTHGIPTSAEATGLSVSWRNGIRFSNEDKSFDVHVGGRLQWDFADAEPSNALLKWSQGGDSKTAFSEPKVSGYGDQVRRARLLIDGTVYKSFEFSDQIEFAPSYSSTTVLKSASLKGGVLTTTSTSLTTGAAVTFADVWGGIKDVPYLGRIRIGQMYEPVGLEQQRSDNFRTFLETSIATTALVPNRNTGLLVENTEYNDRLGWQVGYFFQQQAALSSNGVPLDTTGDLFSPHLDATNVTARVTGLPWYENNGEHLLHLGLGYEHKFRSFTPTSQAFIGQLNPGALDFKSSPEAYLFSPLVDTGNFMAKGVDIVDPELALVYGPFAMQGEVPLAWVSTVRQTSGGPFTYTVGKKTFDFNPDAQFSSWYVEATYFLTGEHRLYNTTATTAQYQGTFGRIYPISDFNPRNGGTGAWELAFRVSNVDLNDAAAGFNGGNEIDFTAGLNWYLNADVLWKFNYIYANVGAHPNGYGNLATSASENIFESRFQVAF
jgi:phosphate-selective porin OprO and OprP